MHQALAVSVMDTRTGFVLYESAQHQPMYPASVTKIMTALLVLEEVNDLSEEVIFSEHAVLSLPYYASRMHVAPGDVMTVYEALYGLMLPSGNEVANALAEHVSGTIEAFVAQMNSRAAELGAVNTHFINPCGLPGDNQHTTAYDMALIMREAINHPVFNEVSGAPNFFVSPTEGLPEGLMLRNTNLLIRPESEYYNPWVLSGKTGFTNAAQHTLVSHARWREHDLIISVLYAPRRATFTDTATLLDYAFNMPVETIFDASSHSWVVPVMQSIDGESTMIGSANVEALADLRIPIPSGMPRIRHEIYIPADIAPPVHIGDVVGSKSFFAGDDLIHKIDLVSANTVFAYTPTPAFRQDTGVNAPDFIPSIILFFALLPVITLVLIGTLVVLLRRHRRMLRRRRRMARIRYARYQGGLE